MRAAVITIAMFITGPLALAGDGRLEINQVSITAAGGFPFTISTPGNYVLTGDLVVPADTDALVLTTSGVVVDLNGFSITGPAACRTGVCGSGLGSAVRGLSGIAHAHDTTVRNGFVRGFANTCIRLGSDAYVTEVRVSECGRNGISVAGGSLVTHNRVSQTGESGMSLSGSVHPPAYAHNAVSDANLSAGTFRAIAGGRATAGNSCDDASCSATLRRRFYLTTEDHPGAEAPSACAAGYHFASFFEIIDPSNLDYDTYLGAKKGDAGSGPIVFKDGSIRTGTFGTTSEEVGNSNCLAWTSTADFQFGTVIHLPFRWTTPSFGPPLLGSPWIGTVLPCDAVVPVWCVSD